MIHDLPGNKLEIRVHVKSAYNARMTATPLMVAVPLPDNAADVKITTEMGRAKFVAEKNAVMWKVDRFPGETQAELGLAVACVGATSKASPATKLVNPISAEFIIPMLSASGLEVRYLTVVEKSGYKPGKWLRYQTQSGKFEVRMI
jgi:AP-2 complex subunit mu-1